MQREDYAQKNFLKKIRKVFVNRNGNVVTLQSEMGKAAASPREGQGRAAPDRFFTIPLPFTGKGCPKDGKGVVPLFFRFSAVPSPFPASEIKVTEKRVWPALLGYFFGKIGM